MRPFDAAQAQEELENLLVNARARGMNCREAGTFILEHFVECGMRDGFLPTDITVSGRLERVTIEILFSDYATDVEITAE